MLRNPSDQFGKNILYDTLRALGPTQTETEVPPGDAQRIDLWFVPDAERQRAGPQKTGILAQIAADAALIELFSEALRDEHFHGCVRSQALRELWALPEDAPERSVAEP